METATFVRFPYLTRVRIWGVSLALLLSIWNSGTAFGQDIAPPLPSATMGGATSTAIRQGNAGSTAAPRYEAQQPNGRSDGIQQVDLADEGVAAPIVTQPVTTEMIERLAPTDRPSGDGYVIGSDTAMQGKWTNDGATLQSKQGDFKYHVRGVAQLDFIGMQQPGSDITVPGGAGTKDAVDFRRLRFGAEGTMYETIDWVFEFDFAFALQNVDPAVGANPTLGLRSVGGAQAGNTTNAVQPTTIFMTFKDLPFFGNARIGNQQSWISLEHIESARFLDFMERSPIMDAFNGANNNGYAPGMSVFNTTEDKRATWALGVYRNNIYDSGYPYDIGNTNYTYGGRATWTPFYDEASNGRYLLHLGIGSELRTFDLQPASYTDGTNIRVRARGDVRNTDSVLCPNFVDTGNFYTESQTVVCPEAALNLGPLLLQAEYEASFLNGAAAKKGGTPLGNVTFQGGYVQALYFLTGENRQYNRTSALFTRVVPLENAYFVKGAGWAGKGAWQLGVRYDWLDLDSGAVQGGNVQNITAGLNWFLNPNLRFQFNYVHSMIDNVATSSFPGTIGSLNGAKFVGDGSIESLGFRMDFNF